MQDLRRYFSNVPLIALLIANVLPLWGVLFWGWDAFLIVLLYWSENLAIGFYTALKIAFVKAPSRKDQWSKLLIIPFFIIHYGGFTAGHGMFVLSMFKKAPEGFEQELSWPCFLAFIELLINVIRQAYSIIPTNMKFVLLGLFVSHGISFVYNYLLKGEYAVRKVESPYGRVVVMHIAIIAGGFLTEAMGSPAGIVFVLVLIKTIMDAGLHLREHEKRQKKLASGAA